jgi:superfamily II helicase
MPTFKGVDCQVNLDFEVYCGTCGAGLCNQSSTRSSRNRGYAQVEVNVCQNCLEEAREEIRRDLEAQIQDLQDKLDRLGYSDD